MTRIIHFNRPNPYADECIWITTDEHFDIDAYLGDEIEIISDNTYPFTVEADLPLNKVLIEG